MQPDVLAPLVHMLVQCCDRLPLLYLVAELLEVDDILLVIPLRVEVLAMVLAAASEGIAIEAVLTVFLAVRPTLYLAVLVVVVALVVALRPRPVLIVLSEDVGLAALPVVALGPLVVAAVLAALVVVFVVAL